MIPGRPHCVCVCTNSVNAFEIPQWRFASDKVVMRVSGNFGPNREAGGEVATDATPTAMRVAQRYM